MVNFAFSGEKGKMSISAQFKGGKYVTKTLMGKFVELEFLLLEGVRGGGESKLTDILLSRRRFP